MPIKKVHGCLCVCVLYVCCWDNVCEFPMATVSVDASAEELVCVLCV